MAELMDLVAAIGAGHRPSDAEAIRLVDATTADGLAAAACDLRDQGHGRLVSYSRKVFIPLTKLCRDVCHYCTFAEAPRNVVPYLSADQVLTIARAGAAAGCREALFTLGDKPELRYRAAREALDELGQESTLTYLRDMAELVFKETGLLPHLNPGIMTAEDLAMLRPVSVSQGIMLESTSPRLMEKGMPHHGSPDKDPAVRLETIALTGEAAVPFTSGILIGIGETRAERIEALLALRRLHDRHGHIQEIIIQNFRAKPDTRMAEAPEPDLDDLKWTIAVARLIYGPAMNIQAPPNLSGGDAAALIDAGINDWGGVSPVTPDFVNPEAPWPHLDDLARLTAGAGKQLVERLAIYPDYAHDTDRWVDRKLAPAVLADMDSAGFARADDWSPGQAEAPPSLAVDAAPARDPAIDGLIAKADAGNRLEEADIVRLFAARGRDFEAVCEAADMLRRRVSGDRVSYVVTRNINYTNVCYFGCRFCAFSKGKTSEALRGKPYDLDLSEIVRRAEEAWARGATEVCLQGGIHPAYTGNTYLRILGAIKQAIPDMHVHAFSPLEVDQGAATLGLPVREFLIRLKAAGLGSLPGTAAEILDDEVREVLCPDKIRTERWLEIVGTAHEVGLRTTSTIMFGHIERPVHWARHLLALRDLQERTGGITEFVALPFVHMEAPMFIRGASRKGPTYREAILMHAVARLVLHPLIPNIQSSWVKMGADGIAATLNAGVNDMGGTLMNESITRAAGSEHGQEMPPPAMEALIHGLDREPYQRTTLYATATEDRRRSSFTNMPLAPTINTPAAKFSRPDQGAMVADRAQAPAAE
jgi:FO synthase